MDPVSQTQASEELALRGLAVVGWYHSHPTFAPIPSVRDIETQAKFQVSFYLVEISRAKVIEWVVSRSLEGEEKNIVFQKWVEHVFGGKWKRLLNSAKELANSVFFFFRQWSVLLLIHKKINSCTLCVPMFFIGMVWKGWRAIHWNYRQSLQLHQCIQPVTNKMPDSQ